jgi:hypothetical protein
MILRAISLSQRLKEAKAQRFDFNQNSEDNERRSTAGCPTCGFWDLEI